MTIAKVYPGCSTIQTREFASYEREIAEIRVTPRDSEGTAKLFGDFAIVYVGEQ